VEVLIYRLPGTHQWRPSARLQGDRFEVDFEPPAAGRYRLLAGVPGRGVRLGDLSALDFLATTPTGERR
jgi:hypothetical protein